MAQMLAYALSTECAGQPQSGHALCVVVRAAAMANDLVAAGDAASELARLAEASETLDWLGESLSYRGMALAVAGQLDDALELTIRAMTSLRQRDALARARRQAGLCQASLGRWTEAIATLELAMRDFAELEPQSPDLAKTMHCLAATHHALGDLESAQRLLAEAIAITEPLAERHPSQFRAHLDMMRDELRALGHGFD
jgi:tetratricopeptide (TPR) repeat protein